MCRLTEGDAMIKYMMIGVLLFSLAAKGGTWERIDHASIRFSGDIQLGDLEGLGAIISPADRTTGPETFERYGIRNVVGHQDFSWGSEMNLNSIHD